MHPRLGAAACCAIFLSTAPASAFACGGRPSTPSTSRQEVCPGRRRRIALAPLRIRGGGEASLPSTRLAAASSADSAPNKKTKNGADASLSSSFDSALHQHRVLLRCLLAIVAYVAVGVVSFSRIFEKWPAVDSLYFSVVTFTTVGYGDLVPTTEAGRLFTLFYSFAGISIVGALLGYVGGNIVEAEKRALERTRSVARARFMGLFHPNNINGRRGAGGWYGRPVGPASTVDAVANNEDVQERKNGFLRRFIALRTGRDGSKSLLRRACDALAQSSYIYVPFVSLALYIGHREGWTTATSLYYAMATASTVGYGDVAPTTPRMRMLAVAFILLAVVSLGEVLGQIAGYFIRQETGKAEREFMDRRMTLDDLEAMDADHDGEVSLFEFLKFMLGSMQKVDNEMMDDLKQLFHRLDETGSNSIRKEDLILMALKRKELWPTSSEFEQIEAEQGV